MDFGGVSRVYAGVDWITCTGKTEESKEALWPYVLLWAAQQMDAGEKPNKHKQHGYNVVMLPGVHYGTGREGWIVRLSGQTASKYWYIPALYAHNVTRLDLAATVWFEKDLKHRIEHVYDVGIANGGELFEKRATLIKSPLKGSTLYYGSRASSQYGRLYDKWREQKLAPAWQYAVRYEVEFKKPVSGAVAEWMLENRPEQQQIAERVFTWFYERHIPVPLDLTNAKNEIQLPRSSTTVERKLIWLEKTVRPTYQQLVMEGWQYEADSALGIL